MQFYTETHTKQHLHHLTITFCYLRPHVMQAYFYENAAIYESVFLAAKQAHLFRSVVTRPRFFFSNRDQNEWFHGSIEKGHMYFEL